MSVYTAFGFKNLGGLSVVNDLASFIRVNVNESLVIGYNAAQAVEGKRNVIMGYEAAIGATTGDDVIMIGFRSGFVNRGNRNMMLGAFSGFTNSTGTDNVFVGYRAADNNMSGRFNVMVGNFTGHTSASDGCNNVVVGHNSKTSGDNNVVLGARNTNQGNDCVLIGHDLSNDGNDDAINILNRIVGRYEDSDSYVIRFSNCSIETENTKESLLKGKAIFQGGARFWSSNVDAGFWDINTVHVPPSNWDLQFRNVNDTVVTFTDAFEAGSLNFTGKHRCSFDGPIEAFYPGCIVVSEGRYVDLFEKPRIEIDESLPVVSIAREDADPRVFGVVAGRERASDPVRALGLGNVKFGFPKPADSAAKLIVNGCGEGAVWVCDANGPFRNGDLIATCSRIPGMGARQPDPCICSHTVAKITCDCAFDLDSTVYRCHALPDGTRIAFVGCVYKCS
jgi:hypothetical protein